LVLEVNLALLGQLVFQAHPVLQEILAMMVPVALVVLLVLLVLVVW